MKAQLVLALCLVAIVACSVVAEEAELQGERMGPKRSRISNSSSAGCQSVSSRQTMFSTLFAVWQRLLCLFIFFTVY
jgi:hypothetical protein